MPGQTRQYVPTRVLLNYDHFEEGLSDGVLVCTSQAMLNALRVLAETYGRREVNWAKTYSAIGYTTPNLAELDKIDAEISLFLEDTNMTFCSDLLGYIALIAQNSASCCNNGKGSTAAGATEDTPTTETDNGVDPPAGFDTYPEYQQYKCRSVNLILDEWQSDLSWIQGGTIATFTAQIMVVALLTPIPFDDLIAFAALLVGMIVSAILAGLATELQDALSAGGDQLVCDLFAAEDITEAETAVSDWLTAQSISSGAALIFSYLVTNDNFNRLFENDPSMDAKQVNDPLPCTCGPATEDWDFEIGAEYLAGSDGYTKWANSGPLAGWDPCPEGLWNLDGQGVGTHLIMTGQTLVDNHGWDDPARVSKVRFRARWSQYSIAYNMRVEAIYVSGSTPISAVSPFYENSDPGVDHSDWFEWNNPYPFNVIQEYRFHVENDGIREIVAVADLQVWEV